MFHREYLTEWENREIIIIFLAVWINLYNKCFKGYHCFIQGEISGKSLPVLTVFVHPLDLILGLLGL